MLFNNLYTIIYSYTNIIILFILLFSCTTEPNECGLGFTEIDGKCYNENDIAVLQAFIDSSSATISMTWDSDSSGSVDPIELSIQKWNDNGFTGFNEINPKTRLIK